MVQNLQLEHLNALAVLAMNPTITGIRISHFLQVSDRRINKGGHAFMFFHLIAT